MPGPVARLARVGLSLLPLYKGKGRIIDRTPLRRLSFPEQELDVRTLDGVTLRVFPNELIGRHLYLRGEFDRHVVDALCQLAQLERSPVLWDIGANIGAVAASVLARLPGSRVVALEPLADVFGLLRNNLMQFSPERAVPIRAALSDRAGMGTIFRCADNLGASHLVTDEVGAAGLESVRLITGDELLERFPAQGVDVIKIDVEGHELAVFKSLGRVLREKRPLGIVFEHDCPPGCPDAAVVRILHDAGYSVFRVACRWNGWTLADADKTSPKGYELSADFIATRPDVSARDLGVT